jgi:hypothetical protein
MDALALSSLEWVLRDQVRQAGLPQVARAVHLYETGDRFRVFLEEIPDEWLQAPEFFQLH